MKAKTKSKKAKKTRPSYGAAVYQKNGELDLIAFQNLTELAEFVAYSESKKGKSRYYYIVFEMNKARSLGFTPPKT